MSRSRQRVPLESGQRLDINRLRRDGHMAKDLDGAKAGTLRVRYPTIGFEQQIEFVSRQRHFGGRQFYFVCPVTGRLASVLWKPNGATRFASRQAWRGQVAYQSQFADRTNRCHLTKAKIQRRLSKDDWSDLLPPRPKRMRHATYAKWETRFDLQDQKLDAMLMRLFLTEWAHLKDISLAKIFQFKIKSGLARLSAAPTGRTHDLHPTASRKPKNPLTRGRRPHMTHCRLSDVAMLILGVSPQLTHAHHLLRSYDAVKASKIQNIEQVAIASHKLTRVFEVASCMPHELGAFAFNARFLCGQHSRRTHV